MVRASTRTSNARFMGAILQQYFRLDLIRPNHLVFPTHTESQSFTGRSVLKRMKKSSFIRPLFAFALAVVSASATLAQGPLTPPGAPGPTMKTLSQIEPRTPISSLPFTISTPGSYYLTTNLMGAVSSSGISVQASDVTIDLRGFSLVGVPSSLSGITVPATQTGLVVSGGSVQSWALPGSTPQMPPAANSAVCWFPKMPAPASSRFRNSRA